jgi:hypothetical protein
MGDNRVNLRFLVDEDVPRSTARVLRDAGFDAIDVRDVVCGGRAISLYLIMPNGKTVCLSHAIWVFQTL